MASKSLVVIGGIALDITATIGKAIGKSILHTSTPGHVKQSLGGVGRNVAEAAWRTGANVKFISVVGNDLAGESVRQGMKSLGMTTEYIQSLGDQPTAVYNALHSYDGQLVAAVADMNIFDFMDTSNISSILQIEKPGFVCFDGNIPPQLMKSIAKDCHTLSVPALFEPTSVSKSLKLFDYAETIQAQSIQYASPNQFELEAMCETIRSRPDLSFKTQSISSNTSHLLKNAPQLAHSVLPNAIYLANYIPNVITKLGEEGCLYVGNNSVIEYFPPEFIQANEIKSVTGAGDCFVGTLIANLQRYAKSNIPIDKLRLMMTKSQMSSIRTLKSNKAVSPEISRDLLV